jgi:glucose/arabinose dehydrogenase
VGRRLAVIGAALALVVPVAWAGSDATPALRLVRVPSAAQNAVALSFAPGEPGRLYIVDKVGVVRVTQKGRVRPKAFLDIRRSVTAGGEQGLLGLAFDPAYARNRLFYVAYTSANGRNVVERFRSNGTTAVLSSRKVLLSVPDPYGNHNGGNLAFGPDGKLYTTIGDGGSGGDPQNRSQNMASRFGKLLRLDVRRATPRWEIAALGLRNAWRFSFDRSTGDLWIGDVGQGSIEEIDYVPRGTTGLLNFGWDVYEGSESFESKPLGPGKLVQPVYEYSHGVGCSVNGGYVYRGKAIPRVAGRYFFGDYCAGTIWSLQLVDGKATDVRSEGISVSSMSSFGEGAGGELYVLSDDGPVYRIAG